jgi:transposase-like protein
MRQINCPFCESADVAFFSLYGQTLLGSQYYCNSCKSIFEVVRFDDEATSAAATPALPPEANKGNT